MKTLTLIAVLLALVLTGCHHSINSGVRGSGKRETQKRDIQPFTSVSSEGAFNIEIVAQKTQSVEIEGDDNILPLIGTDVSGNTLTIKSQKAFSVSEPITLRIAVADLTALHVSGAGSVEITGLKNDHFSIECDGAPSVKVSGSTKNLNINTSGAGKIDTHALHAATGVVDSKGVAKIDVDVKDELDVTISGPSTVTYEGDPKINKTIHGPGKVEKRASEGAWEFRIANENRELRIANCESCRANWRAIL